MSTEKNDDAGQQGDTTTTIENADKVTIESGDKGDDKADAKDDTAGDVNGSAEA